MRREARTQTEEQRSKKIAVVNRLSELRCLPKIELHRHLGGAIRYETLVELAGPLRPRDHHFARGEPRGWTRFFRKFAPLSRVFFTPPILHRIAREAVEDAAGEGIVYLELRFSPTLFARRAGLDPVEAAGAVVESARREARLRGIEVRFLSSLVREAGRRENDPNLRAALEMRPWFVGVDVAGDERTDGDLSHLGPLLRRAKRAGLGLTVHAGETGAIRNVRDAIERWGADRIGHGFLASRDSRAMRLAARRGVPFEVCLTSNRDTGICRAFPRHPIRTFLRSGVPVTLNTDDPAVSATNLVRELEWARRIAVLSVRDLVRMQRTALEHAFLPEEEKRRIRRRLARTAEANS